jgi:hypothetical protein
MARVKPPRGVFGNFPLGHPMGRPLDVEFQINVIKYSLNSLSEMTQPGQIRCLPFRWCDDFSWQNWPGALACYLDKRKSRLHEQKIWHDRKGKAHRKTEYVLKVPGWDNDWIGK